MVQRIETRRPYERWVTRDTPVVLDGGEALLSEEVFPRTRHTIRLEDRVDQVRSGNIVEVTTDYYRANHNPQFSANPTIPRIHVLEGRRRLRVELPDKGIIFVRKAR